MLLKRVEYHLFDHEIDHIDHTGDGSHELDRELCLIDNEERKIFISWRQNKDSFHVEISDKSFFTNDGAVHDASSYDFWQKMLGDDVELKYRDAGKQVLQISAGDCLVYVCAYETQWQTKSGYWGADTLHICRSLPEGPGENLND
jgi:hypothetical protein